VTHFDTLFFHKEVLGDSSISSARPLELWSFPRVNIQRDDPLRIRFTVIFYHQPRPASTAQFSSIPQSFNGRYVPSHQDHERLTVLEQTTKPLNQRPSIWAPRRSIRQLWPAIDFPLFFPCSQFTRRPGGRRIRERGRTRRVGAERKVSKARKEGIGWSCLVGFLLSVA
jgi:hypothetical protein